MGESMITSFDGTKLYLKKETAADNKAVIVIVHGLCEHQGRYDYFAEKLHEAGIGTYRFDHRGHGRSEGEETFYSDFNELLDDTNVVVDMFHAPRTSSKKRTSSCGEIRDPSGGNSSI